MRAKVEINDRESMPRLAITQQSTVSNHHRLIVFRYEWFSGFTRRYFFGTIEAESILARFFQRLFLCHGFMDYCTAEVTRFRCSQDVLLLLPMQTMHVYLNKHEVCIVIYQMIYQQTVKFLLFTVSIFDMVLAWNRDVIFPRLRQRSPFQTKVNQFSNLQPKTALFQPQFNTWNVS